MPLNLRKLKKAVQLFRISEFRSALKFGVAAAIEHKDVIASRKIDMVVDVGANMGQFSLLVSHMHPTCKIVAFEPLEVPAKIFTKIFRKSENVVLFRCALGDANASKWMNVSKSIDSSSLLKITKNQIEEFPGTDKIGEELVDVKSMSDCFCAADISAYSLLKIDVQGYELAVLKGGSSLLKNFLWIYVELSFKHLYGQQTTADEVIKFLDSYDFKLIGVYNPSYNVNTGLCVQCDFLFERK